MQNTGLPSVGLANGFGRDGATPPDWTTRALPRLETRLDRASTEFAENVTAMREQVELLRARYELVQQGGGDEQMRRHRSRGKLPARASGRSARSARAHAAASCAITPRAVGVAGRSVTVYGSF
jgi:hypothetical protein